jgi:hypothetical protein
VERILLKRTDLVSGPEMDLVSNPELDMVSDPELDLVSDPELDPISHWNQTEPTDQILNTGKFLCTKLTIKYNKYRNVFSLMPT